MLIQGFYFEKAQIQNHDYLVSKKLNSILSVGIKTKRSDNPGLLSPIYTDSGTFEDIVASKENELSGFKSGFEYDRSAKRDMASQLVVGYAQVIASAYLTIERIGSKFSNL